MHLYLNGFTYARTSIVDLYVHLYLSAFIFSMTCIYKRRVQDGSGVPLMLFEQLPNHRHRNLKAFEEHIQKHVSSCFVTESYLYEIMNIYTYIYIYSYISIARSSRRSAI